MQPKRGLTRPFHRRNQRRQNHVVATKVRRQSKHHRVHQRLLKHGILKQQRLHRVTDGRIDSAFQSAPLEIGPFAVTPLGDIETCFEHPFGEAIRACDLGRDDRVAVGIQILDVALQAEITNLVPKAAMPISGAYAASVMVISSVWIIRVYAGPKPATIRHRGRLPQNLCPAHPSGLSAAAYRVTANSMIKAAWSWTASRLVTLSTLARP